jgi:hypothetical protein
MLSNATQAVFNPGFAPGLQLGAPTKRRVTPEQKRRVTPEQESRVTPEQKRRVTPEQKSRVTPEQKRRFTPEQKSRVTPEQKRRVTPDSDANNERRPSPKDREARPALGSFGALTRAFGGPELAGRPRRSMTPARTATATATAAAARDGDDNTDGPRSPGQRARETKRQRRSVTPARTATATATAAEARDGNDNTHGPRSPGKRARESKRQRRSVGKSMSRSRSRSPMQARADVAMKVCANCGNTRPKGQWHLSTGERLCQACFSYHRYVQCERAIR